MFEKGAQCQDSINHSALQFFVFLICIFSKIKYGDNLPYCFRLLQDFFKDGNVTSTLQTVSASGKWSPVGKRFISLMTLLFGSFSASLRLY